LCATRSPHGVRPLNVVPSQDVNLACFPVAHTNVTQREVAERNAEYGWHKRSLRRIAFPPHAAPYALQRIVCWPFLPSPFRIPSKLFSRSSAESPLSVCASTRQNHTGHPTSTTYTRTQGAQDDNSIHGCQLDPRRTLTNFRLRPVRLVHIGQPHDLRGHSRVAGTERCHRIRPSEGVPL
jgi:hypothetical protein